MKIDDEAEDQLKKVEMERYDRRPRVANRLLIFPRWLRPNWLRTESRLIGRTRGRKILNEVLLILVPGLLWWAGVETRPRIMNLRCIETPAVCDPALVNPIDRVAIGKQNDHIDKWSFVTQNWSGYLAVAVPTAWTVTRVIVTRIHPAAAFAALGTDLLLLAQATVWNGLLMEATRWAVQRPRPFVFENPAAMGGNPAHYTSFYSGHTSFAALAVTSWLLALSSRSAPAYLIGASAITGIGLVLGTATLRVAAGRHYPTDTIVGALAGILVALAVARIHRKP